MAASGAKVKPDQLLNVGVVAAAETEEADLLEAAAGDHLVHRLQDLFHRPLAHGAEDHAGLAEAAAARAAAHDFNGGAVVDDVDVGHDELRHRGRHDGNDALHHRLGSVWLGRTDGGDDAVGAVACLVKGGYIDAGDLGEHLPKPAAGLCRQVCAALTLPFPLFMHVDDLEDHLFAFADDHGVEECAHRLRVVTAGAAGDHERVGSVAVGGAQGEPGQVEHSQDVGVELLVGKREGEYVELADRVAGLQAEEGDAVPAHHRLEVAPGAVNALGEQVVALVDQVVEHHQAQVGAAELVNVGEGERRLAADGGIVPRLGNAVELAAGVAGGLRHFVQDAVKRP